MASPSLRLVASNPSVRRARAATRHPISMPPLAAPAERIQSHISLLRMAIAAAAVPMLWMGHALLVHLHVL